MGYYSEVALILKNSAWEAVLDHFADNIAVETTLNCASKILYRNEYTILGWPSLKLLEPIKTIISYLVCKEYDYHYARVGEAVEDVEESFSEYDDIMNEAFYIPHHICFEREVTDIIYNKQQASRQREGQRK